MSMFQVFVRGPSKLANLFLFAIIFAFGLGIITTHTVFAKSNFTTYASDKTNTTAIIEWSGKYCNWSNTHPPTHIAKHGDSKHTTDRTWGFKTYNTAIDIISNNINSDTEKIDNQGKHCEKVSNTIDEMRTCMGLS